MTTRTLYVKSGRRYVPVSEWEIQGRDWQAGHHLTVVEPGLRFTRYNVNPDKAGLLAELYRHQDACIEAIRKMTDARPSIKQPLTPKQAEAWRKWQDACGALYGVEIPAVHECFDAIVRIVENA